METHPDTGNDDMLSGRCGVPACQVVAEIVVADTSGAELEVCRQHWHEALQRSNGLIRGVRLIRRPPCFLSDCASAAVEVIEDHDGLPRPVCGTHWDDLSWVGHLPPDLATRAPGWSHGG